MSQHNTNDRHADFRKLSSSKPKIACNDIVATGIAMLSDEEVKAMTRSEIMDAVKAAEDVPQSPVKPDRIFELDTDRLRRVLHLVRRWMRVAINKQSRQKGWTPFFREQA